MKKIIKKHIFKIQFTLASPLAIGSGENELTDKDIMYGSDGRPYIPASSIAGVCVSSLMQGKDKSQWNNADKSQWGYVPIVPKDEKDKAIESSVIFYDAVVMVGEKFSVSIRDSVALDEYKTAKDGSKFDMMVLEPGVKFVTYLEQSFHSADEKEVGYEIAMLFLSQNLFLGGKTSRGYGAIKDVEVVALEVRFDKSVKCCENIEELDLSRWIDAGIWDLSKNEWKPLKKNPNGVGERQLVISLQQEGGISIRRYTTDAPNKEEKEKSDIKIVLPDYTQLTLANDIPVIPGTTWAGAFRHQMSRYMGDDNQEDLNYAFGGINGNNKGKSRIRFGESELSGTISKKMTRTAINRFTGGASDGSLYTEKTVYNGTTNLTIGFAKGYEMPENVKHALICSILDLHYGFMAIGGETSIGRGLFSIVDGNLANKSAQDLYDDIKDKLSKALK